MSAHLGGGEVGPGACVDFLVGGIGVCPLMGGAGLVPLIGRAVSRGVFGGGCELGLAVNNLPAMQELQETRAQSLGEEDPLEKEMATHSSTLACRIPWAEEPGGLQSTGSQESDRTGRLDHRRSLSGAAHLG